VLERHVTVRDAVAARSGASGFTLIELIVTITIAAILMMLAAPSFITYRQNSQLTAAANSFLAAAAAARSEAMKRQLNAFLRPADATNWANGWTTYVDTDWSRNYSTGDTQIVAASTPLPANVTVPADTTSSDSYGHYVMFMAMGYAGDAMLQTPITATNLAITFSNGSEKRLVIIEGSGRMRVCNPVGDTTCASGNVF
jgi:type IV fimbrial biogenesis protein FimT